MKARVTVTLKTGVLDPQGKAIEGALRSLGVEGVASVRQGKVFDIELEGADKAAERRSSRPPTTARQYGDRELPDRGRRMIACAPRRGAVDQRGRQALACSIDDCAMFCGET